MKILITGGAGFIGSNLAHEYLEQGTETLVYDNLSRQGVEKNLAWLKKHHPKLVFHKQDVRDYGKLAAVMRGIDVVYHLASQVAVTKSVADPSTDFEINALGTLNVLEAARAQKTPPVVVYASTNKVYGGMEGVKLVEGPSRYDYADPKLKQGISEAFPTDFHSPYGCSKGAGDQYVHDYARIYGMRTVVLRQSCIYGARQFGNEDQGWVAHFARRALDGKSITIYGNGKQVRDLLAIDDLIDCFRRSLVNIRRTGGEIYNIGGGRQRSVSLRELLRILETRLGKKIKTRINRWRPGDQRVYISNIAKAEKHFGWRPRKSVEQGLEQLLHWLDTI